MRIKEISESLRPREKMLRNGAFIMQQLRGKHNAKQVIFIFEKGI